MHHPRRALITLAGFLAPVVLIAQTPNAAALKLKEHPRLLMSPARLQEIGTLKDKDANLKLLVDNLVAFCEATVPLPPEEMKLDRGNMLPTARAMLGRMANLSMGYLLTKKPDYKTRALKEAEAAAKFETWLPDPYHFLDAAEMTLGFAIVYDWLYAELSEGERTMLRGAMVKHGLTPAAAKYVKGDGFVVGSNNWNQVCNGGFSAGAIALLTEEKKLAEDILSAAVKSAEYSKNAFAPDGVSVEGIAYWSYANDFGAVLYDSLQVAFGSDYGLSNGAGLNRTAEWADAVLPNEGGGDVEGFNFGDVGGISRWYAGGASWYWLARRFGAADMFAGNESKQRRQRASVEKSPQEARNLGRMHALNIVWFTPHQPRRVNRPLDSLFNGPVPIVTMRSSWTDANATHLFLKGGDNAASHGHLDLGSFEMIADGVKWAHDLGMDSYSVPGYFGKPEERASVFRVSTRSHNTLTFGGANQKLDGVASIVAFATAPAFAVSVVDLAKAYAVPKTKTFLRGFLFDRRRVLVQDELELDEPTERVRWGMVTKAEAKTSGSETILSTGGKTLVLKLISPPGAVFSEISMNPPTTAENPNVGMRMIGIEIPRLPRGKHRIAVMLCPGDSAALPAPAMRPLTDWLKSHPVKGAK
jgi:hypothetical protein